MAEEISTSADTGATATGTGVTATETAANQPKTALDFVTERQEAKEIDDAEGATGEKEAGKGPKKQTVQERIAHYSDKAKAAEAERDAAKAEIKTISERFEAEIASIKEMLGKGRISPTEAQHAETAATVAKQESFDEVLGGISDDLKPYADDLRRLMDAAIRPYREAEEQRQRADEEKRWGEERATRKTNYESYYDLYPDFFEAQAGTDGMRAMKPEFDAEALKLAEHIDITTKEGLDMLMYYLGKSARDAEKQKAETAAVEKAKRGRVETSGISSSATKGEPESILAIAERRFKQMRG